jgi:hypothetical protein
VTRAPDLLEELPVRQHHPRVLDQERQQLVLDGGQVHFLALNFDDAPNQVDPDSFSDLDD